MLVPAAIAARAARPAVSWRIAQWRRFVERSERWDPEALERYQVDRLRALLAHARATVPYYREVLGAAGVEPGDIRSVADLATLPILEKSTVQERQADLLSTAVPPGGRFYFTTSGSSGTPVAFWHDVDQERRERAFMASQWARVGYTARSRSAVLRGTVVPEGLWFKDLRNAALVMSSYDLREELIPEYVRRLRRLRPQFVQAYPSSAAVVAQYLLDHGLPPIPGVKAVLCGSENLYPWQRTLVERAFGCRVFSWYGQSEAVVLAGECEHSTKLHVFPQYGAAELVDADGLPVTEPGVPGEIVGTQLHARAMPLIRYRTGDVGVLAAGRCEACGRPYPLLERIEGRLQEFVVGSNGRRISIAAINMHTGLFDNVRQFRFVQRRPGELTLRLVPGAAYDEAADGARIRTELAPKLGGDIALALELVDELPRDPSGKFRFLDQSLDVGLDLQYERP
jgi:phenylacetate-CoA ligase